MMVLIESSAKAMILSFKTFHFSSFNFFLVLYNFVQANKHSQQLTFENVLLFDLHVYYRASSQPKDVESRVPLCFNWFMEKAVVFKATRDLRFPGYRLLWVKDTDRRDKLFFLLHFSECSYAPALNTTRSNELSSVHDEKHIYFTVTVDRSLVSNSLSRHSQHSLEDEELAYPPLTLSITLA